MQSLSKGIRVNTGLNFVEDPRYAPCRAGSKLGVPLAELSLLDACVIEDVEGLHIHTNCESTDLTQLVESLDALVEAAASILKRMRWLNIGGGYHLAAASGADLLRVKLDDLIRSYELEIFMEPGAALVQSAGFIVGRVIDLIEGDPPIAVLDISANHWPDLLDFEYEPSVVDAVLDGSHRYVLAGPSCLAGDAFGEHNFGALLRLGDRVTLRDAGAYSIVRASFFNGIGLPNVYLVDNDGCATLWRQFGYPAFGHQLG